MPIADISITYKTFCELSHRLSYDSVDVTLAQMHLKKKIKTNSIVGVAA